MIHCVEDVNQRVKDVGNKYGIVWFTANWI